LRAVLKSHVKGCGIQPNHRQLDGRLVYILSCLQFFILFVRRQEGLAKPGITADDRAS